MTDERGRLAREIHDTIAQSLTGLVMLAQRAGNRLDGVDGDAAASVRGDIELIEQMATRGAHRGARHSWRRARRSALEAGLADALGRLATSFPRETGVVVDGDGGCLGGSTANRGRAAPLRAGGTRERAQARRGAARDRSRSLDRRRGRAHGDRRRRRTRRRRTRRAGLRARRHARSRSRSSAARSSSDPAPRRRRLRVAVLRRAADPCPHEHGRRTHDPRASSSPTTTPSCVPASSGCSSGARTSRSWARPSTASRPCGSRRSRTPDLVLMDLRMPGVDGARRPRASWPQAAAARVLVLTTYETDDHILRGDRGRARAATCSRRRRRRRSSRASAPSPPARPCWRRRSPRSSCRGCGPTRHPWHRPRSRRGNSRCCARRRRTLESRDRAQAVHRRGDGEDAPAARVREARRERSHARGHAGDGARPALSA